MILQAVKYIIEHWKKLEKNERENKISSLLFPFVFLQLDLRPTINNTQSGQAEIPVHGF